MGLCFDPDRIDAVIFDMGGVFFLPAHRRIRHALASAGLAVTEEPAAYRRAHYEGARAYDTSRDEPETWDSYFSAYLRASGVADADLPVAWAAVEGAWRSPASEHWTWTQPESVKALQGLADAGLALAVVSNCDGTAVACLAQTGVCQVGPGPGVDVSAIVDSELVGIQKPDPGIFEPALAAVDVPAHRAVYVGDTVRNDVHGAQAAGMHAVHLDPYGLYPEAEHDRVTSLLDLADHLDQAEGRASRRRAGA